MMKKLWLLMLASVVFGGANAMTSAEFKDATIDSSVINSLAIYKANTFSASDADEALVALSSILGKNKATSEQRETFIEYARASDAEPLIKHKLIGNQLRVMRDVAGAFSEYTKAWELAKVAPNQTTGKVNAAGILARRIKAGVKAGEITDAQIRADLKAVVILPWADCEDCLELLRYWNVMTASKDENIAFFQAAKVAIPHIKRNASALGYVVSTLKMLGAE